MRQSGIFITALVALGLGMLAYQVVGNPVGPAIPVAGPWDDAVQLALRRGKPTIVEFGANACIACRDMKPVLETLRREHADRIAVVDVDVIAQKERSYISRYRIQLMPTQVFYDAQGRETSRHVGKIAVREILDRLGVSNRSLGTQGIVHQ